MRRPIVVLALITVFVIQACSSDSDPTQPELPSSDAAAFAAAESRKGGNGNGTAKVDICHLNNAGDYVVHNIAETAVNGHRGHGDGFPGEDVPGQSAKFLGDCQPVEVGPGKDVIGVSGGAVVSANEIAVLTLPPGAVSEWTLIGIEPDDLPEFPGAAAGTGFRFSPDGIRFEAPVTVTIRYSDTGILTYPEGQATIGPVETLLRFFKFEDGNWQAPEGTADSGTNTVTASLDGFSGGKLGGPTWEKVCALDPDNPGCEPLPACYHYLGWGTLRFVNTEGVELNREDHDLSIRFLKTPLSNGKAGTIFRADGVGYCLKNVSDLRARMYGSGCNAPLGTIRWTRDPAKIGGASVRMVGPQPGDHPDTGVYFDFRAVCAQ